MTSMDEGVAPPLALSHGFKGGAPDIPLTSLFSSLSLLLLSLLLLKLKEETKCFRKKKKKERKDIEEVPRFLVSAFSSRSLLLRFASTSVAGAVALCNARRRLLSLSLSLSLL